MKTHSSESIMLVLQMPSPKHRTQDWTWEKPVSHCWRCLFGFEREIWSRDFSEGPGKIENCESLGWFLVSCASWTQGSFQIHSDPNPEGWTFALSPQFLNSLPVALGIHSCCLPRPSQRHEGGAVVSCCWCDGSVPPPPWPALGCFYTAPRDGPRGSRCRSPSSPCP